jgi:hypothetical protein
MTSDNATSEAHHSTSALGAPGPRRDQVADDPEEDELDDEWEEFDDEDDDEIEEWDDEDLGDLDDEDE